MSRNGRPPSMADVAEMVGVSHQTVSRVVNGKGRVSPRTRERVQAAIEQLGYRPNSVARALVTARSGIIGVVTTTSAHFGPSAMLVALEVAAREAGLFTSVVALDRFGPDDVASAFDHFSSLAAEAIVVIAPVDSLAEAVASQGASVPVIAVSGGRTFGRGVSVVHADQRGGARALAEHLTTLGHRDIACVAGPQEWFEARERVAGWRWSRRVCRCASRSSARGRRAGGTLQDRTSSRMACLMPSCARTMRSRSASSEPSPRPG
mgnify:CR=1 FL=1